ncbi:PIG-P-domain-containing protein [Amylostereum chailletii]|nr:PIG-P-domain-containing protein [Amylostereum chailletii]
MPSTKDPPTSPTAPLAPFPPPPPSPEDRSLAPEFYGFVAWSTTYLLFGLYLLWALLPDPWILALGVEWYPSREWALLVPAWTVVLVLLTYATYFAMAIHGTPSFADLSTLTDTKALLPDPPTDPSASPWTSYAGFADAGAPPEAYDIPIGLVNRVLYSDDAPRIRTPASKPTPPSEEARTPARSVHGTCQT